MKLAFRILIINGLLILSLHAEENCLLPPEASLTDLQDTANTLCLFSKPLVLGASVSAGFGTGTGGPATILSKLMNPNSQINNRAISGATSIQSTRGLTLTSRPPSSVLAFDLFFWDAVKNECGDEFVLNTRKLFDTFSSKKVPMVVGKIPVGVQFPPGLALAAMRPCTRVINSLLTELCLPENNCLIYDPKDCVSAMKGPASPEGFAYFRDPLHTSTEGNKFCAQQFRASAKYKSLDCQVK